MDLHVIQRILGHAQVSTTRIYTDPTDPLTREAVDRIGRTLWPDEVYPANRAGEELRQALASLDRDTAVRILRDLLAENGAADIAMSEPTANCYSERNWQRRTTDERGGKRQAR